MESLSRVSRLRAPLCLAKGSWYSWSLTRGSIWSEARPKPRQRLPLSDVSGVRLAVPLAVHGLVAMEAVWTKTIWKAPIALRAVGRQRSSASWAT
jgi:hypothetical protein